MSEKRGKPGRPKKSEVVKKFLRKTITNPVGRPKMTEEQKKAYTGRRRGRPAKKKKGRKNQEDEQKRIEKDILAIERQIARANGEPIPRTIEECVISEDESKPRRNYFGRFNKKNDGETPVKQEEEYSGQEEADEDGNG